MKKTGLFIHGGCQTRHIRSMFLKFCNPTILDGIGRPGYSEYSELICSRKSGYTGYIVDTQQLKWLHNWLQIFETDYIIDSQ